MATSDPASAGVLGVLDNGLAVTPSASYLDPLASATAPVPLVVFPSVILGSITFALTPRDRFPVREKPRYVRHDPPGGRPRYQMMGGGESTLTLTGKLAGALALTDLVSLRALNGTRQPLSYGAFACSSCWVELDWSYLRDDEIDYELLLRLESPLVIDPSQATGATSTPESLPPPVQVDGVPTMTNPLTQGTATVTYTIVAGDNLWNIAGAQYDNPTLWPVIYRANVDVIGSNPDLIYPGQVLTIPADAGAAQTTQTQQATELAALPTG